MYIRQYVKFNNLQNKMIKSEAGYLKLYSNTIYVTQSAKTRHNVAYNYRILFYSTIVM